MSETSVNKVSRRQGIKSCQDKQGHYYHYYILLLQSGSESKISDGSKELVVVDADLDSDLVADLLLLSSIETATSALN